MVETIRVTERALGHAEIGPTPEEDESRRFRRSLFVVEDIAAGEALTEQNVRSIRPAAGMHPREYEAVLGGLPCATFVAGHHSAGTCSRCSRRTDPISR